VCFFQPAQALRSSLLFCIADRLVGGRYCAVLLENCCEISSMIAAPQQCSIEGFRQLLNVECDTAIVAANLIGVCGFVVIMFICIVIIKRRFAFRFLWPTCFDIDFILV